MTLKLYKTEIKSTNDYFLTCFSITFYGIYATVFVTIIIFCSGIGRLNLTNYLGPGFVYTHLVFFFCFWYANSRNFMRSASFVLRRQQILSSAYFCIFWRFFVFITILTQFNIYIKKNGVFFFLHFGGNIFSTNYRYSIIFY